MVTAQQDAEAARDVAVSPDGRHFYTITGESITIWKREETGLVTHEKTETVPSGKLNDINIIRTSPTGDSLIVASTKTRTIMLFARDRYGHVRDQSINAASAGLERNLVDVQYHPSGKQLYVVKPCGIMTDLEDSVSHVAALRRKLWEWPRGGGMACGSRSQRRSAHRTTVRWDGAAEPPVRVIRTTHRLATDRAPTPPASRAWRPPNRRSRHSSRRASCTPRRRIGRRQSPR